MCMCGKTGSNNANTIISGSCNVYYCHIVILVIVASDLLTQCQYVNTVTEWSQALLASVVLIA